MNITGYSHKQSDPITIVYTKNKMQNYEICNVVCSGRVAQSFKAPSTPSNHEPCGVWWVVSSKLGNDVFTLSFD